jgi:hypothetical protein
MRRFTCFTAYAAFLASCATGGYDITSGVLAQKASPSAGVVLYGVDETAGMPPPSCRVLGSVRAWSFGEKTFPYDQLRAAAAELGGDSVLDIKPDPSAKRNRPTHTGTIAQCR